MTDNGTIEAFRGDEQKAIERFKGDDTEAFSSGLFFIFFLCLFVFSSFPGFIRGQRRLIVLFSLPEIFYQASTLLNTYGPRLKDCRGDERRVIEPSRGRLKTARKSPG